VELDSIPQSVRERLDQIGTADLVVGLLSNGTGTGGESVHEIHQTLKAGFGKLRAVIIQDGQAAPEPVEESESQIVLSWNLIGPERATSPAPSISDAFQLMFTASQKLEARACCVVASDLQNVTSGWISGLTQPVLEMDYGLVTPRYTNHRFEGLLNTGIVYPITRALYGKRIYNPMGPDLGISGHLIQQMLAADPKAKATGNRIHPVASLAPTAICGGLAVGQAYLGARVYPPVDWTNASSLLAQVLGSVFLDMERYAVHWQKTRGSVSVPDFGEPNTVTEETGAVDVKRLVDSFQLGARDLQEIWSLVLPPMTLMEVRRLSRQAPDQFRMPDELWVRIVYDFALGHRLRTISRDHLLRAMTPLYLGWVASFALELETAGPGVVERRRERLCEAYESQKPYLVSRWRWPDRFNP
jgi:glucosylglycerate synthase